jgi:hypothetical protein
MARDSARRADADADALAHMAMLSCCTKLVGTPRIERARGCHGYGSRGGLATVGRVPSWPQGGRAGTDDFRIVSLAEMEVAKETKRER